MSRNARRIQDGADPAVPNVRAEGNGNEAANAAGWPRVQMVAPQAGQEMADNGSSPVERLGQAAEAPIINSGFRAATDVDQAPAPDEASSVAMESEEAMLRLPRGAMPLPLRGSLESLERQNMRLDAEGLERIEDEADLASRIVNGLLVPVPVSAGLTVNSDLLENHRYCRPWTARFLADLAREHEAVFHKPLLVSSAVRTVEYQRRLMHINGNAAPAEGDVVSPHLTGATVDIAKSGLSRQEMAWMRQRLLALESAGKIDVEEEFRQACFHITVYRDYVPATAPVEAKGGTRKAKRPAAPSADAQVSTQGM
jgi:hypothetical protein